MTDRETLKLALEALVDFGWHIENCQQFPTWAEPKKHPPCTCGYDTAITALRQALAQQRLSDSIRPKGKSITKVWVDEINRALEQPEPAAWKHDCSALLTNDVELWIDRCPHCGKPRTAPPKREFIGLTDEELRDALRECPKDSVDALRVRWLYAKDFARAIEAKLKEKNTCSQ